MALNCSLVTTVISAGKAAAIASRTSSATAPSWSSATTATGSLGTENLDVEHRGEYTLSLGGRGSARLVVGEQLVLDGENDELSRIPSHPLRLSRGLNRLLLAYHAPATGDAEVRLYWRSNDFAKETVPATVAMSGGIIG